MTPFIRGLVASAALAVCAPFASAAVLSFDDIVGADGYASVPSNYGGLDWSAAGWSVFSSVQSPYTPHSGNGQITTNWGVDAAGSVIRFLTPTVFEGAWFSGFADAAVTFQMFLGGQLVASSSTLNLSDTSTFLSSGWTGAIDAVTVVSNVFEPAYAMDDFSFQDRSEVPEPGTLALMLAGLGLVARTARRRKA